MKFTTHFGKRKLYLRNFNRNLQHDLSHLGKFIVQQIRQDFYDATYNDQVTGLLYNFDCESNLKNQLNPGEGYFVVLVSAEAISHITFDGQVFVHPGFEVKVLAFKTHTMTWDYCSDRAMFVPRHSYAMAEAGQRIYNHRPERWLLFDPARSNQRKRIYSTTEVSQATVANSFH